MASKALSAPRCVAALKALASARDWSRALALLEAFKLDAAEERDPATLLLLQNAALSACSRASRGAAALGLLRALREEALSPDNVSFNSTITAVGRSSDWQRSFSLLEEMREQQLLPCSVTFGALTDSCDKASQWEAALHVLEDLDASGIAGNAMVLSSVINATGKSHRWELALAVLSEAAGRGIVADGISYNCGINACRRATQWSKAVELLGEMQRRSMTIDAMTYQAAMKACGAGRQWQLAARLQEQLLAEQQRHQQQQQQEVQQQQQDQHPQQQEVFSPQGRAKPLRGRRWSFDPVKVEEEASRQNLPFTGHSSSSTSRPKPESASSPAAPSLAGSSAEASATCALAASSSVSEQASIVAQSRGSGHVPVLCTPVIEALLNNDAGGRQGLYIDCTFGRGGHARELLRYLDPSSSTLFAFDMDPTAIAEAKRLAVEDPRLVPLHMPFGDLATLSLPCKHGGKASGLLADLGVSSPQLDQKQRGFSVMEDGPLDLRMNPTVGLSAADWLATVSAEELTRVIQSYGEDGDPILAARIAEAIVARVKEQPPLRRTQQLAEVVARVKRDSSANLFQQPARLTFQAIRSHLNSEFQQLDIVLDAAMEKLHFGGRFVIICFKRAEVEAVRRFVRLHEECPPGILETWPREKVLELYPLLKRDSGAVSEGPPYSSELDSEAEGYKEISGSMPASSSKASSVTSAKSSPATPQGQPMLHQDWCAVEVCPPLRATAEETRANTRSRSARALVLEKRRRSLPRRERTWES